MLLAMAKQHKYCLCVTEFQLHPAPKIPLKPIHHIFPIVRSEHNHNQRKDDAGGVFYGCLFVNLISIESKRLDFFFGLITD